MLGQEFLGPYLTIVVVLILTGCGLPIPEEVPIIAAGVACYLGTLDPWLAFGSCIVGALLGDLAMYGIGRHFGRRLLYGRWSSRWLTEENEQRAEEMIKQHGLKVFLVARFLVGIRAPMYVSAGILRVPVTRFLFIDGICATLVVGTVFGLSYYFGDSFKAAWDWIHESQIALTVVLAVLGAIIVLYFWLRHRRRKRRRASEVQSTESRQDSAREEERVEETESVV